MMAASFADLIGDAADRIVREHLNIGDIHIIPLGRKEGITPKGEEVEKDKFFIILGFDKTGNAIGGVVVNSHINYNLGPAVSDYMLPVRCNELPFLRYDSFVNCSSIITANPKKFNATTYRGHVSDDLLVTIRKTIAESPTTDKAILKTFGLCPD